ncbi:MAG: hypothetical protein GXO10_02885 [Crenarchaeota archaeon]|nr:hypothetical protein [Thermoproteota archaeon]
MSTIEQRREVFYRRLIEEAEKGLVDFDIKDFLFKFNEKCREVFTTSSCSGRIILAEAPRLSLVKSSHEFKFLAKWHRPVVTREILEVIDKYRPKNAWLLVRAPIIHFSARSLDVGLKLLRIAQSVGFKHSGVISLREYGEVVVEVQADDRIDTPIIIDGEWVIRRENIDTLIQIANEALMIGKLRLVNLIGMLEREFLRTCDFKPIELNSIVTYREFIKNFDIIMRDVLARLEE